MFGKKTCGNNFFIQNAGPKRSFSFGDKLKSISEKNSCSGKNVSHYLRTFTMLKVITSSHDILQSFPALTKHRTPYGSVEPYRISVRFSFNCFIHVFMVPYSHQLPRLSLTQATVPPTIRSDQRLALEL